jgi:hypothetical protein|tara:strand:- start:10 stop:432 length:423 start_codon:yes stop_codon:yes gene_type:complete
MNLETIQSMWEKDSQIDQIKIHDEAAKIPSLHAKYWDVYNTLKLLREKAKTQESSIRLERYNYYTGKSSPEVYEAEPFPYRVREKDVIKQHLDADKRLQEITLKIKYYDVMLTYLEDIVRQINNRSYQLKNIIDWQQLSG